MQNDKIIFLYSQSPRSGHNYVTEVIRQIVPSMTTPLGKRSEIPIAPLLAAYKSTLGKFYKSKGAIGYLNDLFLEGLRDKICNNGDHLMLKYTSFQGAESARLIFPKDIHIITFRDPKDCLISLFKSMKLGRDFKSILKRLLLPFGIYHFSYALRYSNRIQKQFPKLDEFYVIKYEDVVMQNQKTLNSILELFDNPIDLTEFKARLNSIAVLNSSFYKEETTARDMWESSKQTKSFNPVNRTKGMNVLQKLGVKLGARSLRKKMGYV